MRKKAKQRHRQPHNNNSSLILFWKRRTNQTIWPSVHNTPATSETIKWMSVPSDSLALCRSLPLTALVNAIPSNFKIPNVFNYLFNIKTFHSIVLCLRVSLSSSSSWFVLFHFHKHVKLVFWALQLFVLVPFSGNVGMMYTEHNFETKQKERRNETYKFKYPYTYAHRHQIIN